jgi:aerobic-type carbon monoxide dehydrogenase small subunit (CoxS/CutS family)
MHAIAEEVEGLIAMRVNGQDYALAGVKPHWSLAFILREKLGLTGTKVGCDRGSCGTCTVLKDGEAVYSCMVPAVHAGGSEIQTVEGLSDGIILNPVQQAFYNNDAVQCGYCTPGFLMAAQALLNSNSSPSRADVNEALSGHICTCGHYKKVVDAVLSV